MSIRISTPPARNSRNHSRSRSCNRGTSAYVPPPPPMPPRPTLEEYKVPKPTFVADLQRVSKFNYFFGLDSIQFKKSKINNKCCFVSREIEIGDATEVSIDANYLSGDNTSIEFYIINENNIEIPIAPENKNNIKNELVFFNKPLRFNNISNIKIKKNGIDTSLKIDEANKLSDAIYTADYTVKDSNRIAVNNKIRVKIILRMYNDNVEPPYISNVLLKTYGGGKLWLDI